MYSTSAEHRQVYICIICEEEGGSGIERKKESLKMNIREDLTSVNVEINCIQGDGANTKGSH